MKRMSKTKKYILGIIVSLLFIFIPGGIFLSFNENSIIGVGIICCSSLALMFFTIALIVHVLKLILNKATSKHESNKEKYEYGIDDTYCFKKTSEPLTWGVIIAALVVLFPLGIFYTILKVSSEKSQYYLNGVKLIIIGSAFMIMTLGPILMFVMNETDDISSLILVCSIPGVYFLLGLVEFIIGLVLKHKGNLNEKYLFIIKSQQITRLDKIAQIMKTTYAKVTEHIQKLIDNDLLKNSYIYHRDREVIVPGISKKIAFKCANCGGTSVVYINEEKVCDYCGAKI